MTDLRQAAQQALEALEGWEHCDEWVWPVSALEQSKRNTTESLATLRAALGEQQAEPVAWNKGVLPMYPTQKDGETFAVSYYADLPQQQAEPVAYLCENAVGHKYFRWKKPSSTYKPIALYTTPPQRPWVGLTVTTILNMMPSAIPAEYDGPLMEFARAIEAKLEKKNGY